MLGILLVALLELLENVMRSALVSPLSDRIGIEMCSLTIDDVDSGRLNDRYRATCGKTMGSENNGTAIAVAFTRR